MACACQGSPANTKFEVTTPDGEKKIVDSAMEARVIRASAGPATIVRQLPKTA